MKYKLKKKLGDILYHTGSTLCGKLLNKTPRKIKLQRANTPRNKIQKRSI